MQAMTFEGPRAELYLMPLASSRYGLPDAYAQAVALFEEASADYAKKNAAQAAPKFVKVAELLQAPKPATTYSEAFAKMRAASYRDAAIAYADANKKADGKKALTAALAKDADNAALLKELTSKL